MCYRKTFLTPIPKIACNEFPFKKTRYPRCDNEVSLSFNILVIRLKKLISDIVGSKIINANTIVDKIMMSMIFEYL